VVGSTLTIRYEGFLGLGNEAQVKIMCPRWLNSVVPNAEDRITGIRVFDRNDHFTNDADDVALDTSKAPFAKLASDQVIFKLSNP
jgi:hypothetical protein